MRVGANGDGWANSVDLRDGERPRAFATRSPFVGAPGKYVFKALGSSVGSRERLERLRHYDLPRSHFWRLSQLSRAEGCKSGWVMTTP